VLDQRLRSDRPYAERAGHDLGYIALAGVLAMGGEAGGAPGMPGVQIADLAGGALWGATAILGALVGRQRTGKGAHLDISMTEGALALLAAEIGNMDCGERPTRGKESLNGGLACYSVYKAKDDRYLASARSSRSSGSPSTPRSVAAQRREVVGKPHEQAKTRAELAAIFATKTARVGRDPR